jgi:hypothetical protein
MVQRVQTMVWPYVFGQSIMVAGAHIIRESTSPYDEKKTERESQEGIITTQAPTPSDLLLLV